MREVTFVAKEFVRAGGNLTLSEWDLLTAEQRSMFVQAKEEVEAGRVAEIIRAVGVAIEGAIEEHRLESLIGKAEEIVS